MTLTLNETNSRIAVQLDCTLARMRAESRAILSLDRDLEEAVSTPASGTPFVESVFREFVATCPALFERSEILDSASDALVEIAKESRKNERNAREIRPRERFVASFSTHNVPRVNAPDAFDSFLIDVFDLRVVNLSAKTETEAIVGALRLQRSLDLYIKARASLAGVKVEDRIFTRPALHLFRVTPLPNGSECWEFVHY